MYSLSKIIKSISLIALTLGCFGLAPQARAVCQEGCLTNGNTVLGDDALLHNTSFDNTAVGSGALTSNTTGIDNTATGSFALFFNTIGILNTANGFQALLSNTTGDQNAAVGAGALQVNTTGSLNTATGAGALGGNTLGSGNTAIGAETLSGLVGTGNNNTALGWRALRDNQIGSSNMAAGEAALADNTRGNQNTACGAHALVHNKGSGNIALGFAAGFNLKLGDNNIDIGNPGIAGESANIRIGNKGHKNTFIAGISGVTVAAGVGVIIDTDGHLGTVVSSERFKDAVRPMDKASEAILSLKPVTFRYKTALDPEGIPQFGLVAEQVAKVDPDLVVSDEKGKPYTVRYEAVNAMLLNEFLKEHRKVEELEATVTQLQAAFKAQAAQIQKVSDQLGVQAPAPRVVVNN